MSSVFEFEKMSFIKKINSLCKNNNTLHVFLELSYQLYEYPSCSREQPHAPTWCNNECGKQFFKKL